MLILDAQRLARELSLKRDEASVPTDSGPIRLPLSERVRDITIGRPRLDRVESLRGATGLPAVEDGPSSEVLRLVDLATREPLVEEPVGLGGPRRTAARVSRRTW